MKLRFPYRQQSLLTTGASLSSGAAIVYRPFIGARVVGPSGRRYHFGDVLVDTGSIATVFPGAFAQRLGVTLQTHDVRGAPFKVIWRGRTFLMSYGTAEIEVRDSAGGILRWTAEIGFSDAPIGYPILGQAGALEYLDATFRLGDLTLELEPNRFFSGVASGGAADEQNGRELLELKLDSAEYVPFIIQWNLVQDDIVRRLAAANYRLIEFFRRLTTSNDLAVLIAGSPVTGV